MPEVIIKVCGITNADDLRVAVDAGATALGFIFHPPSPRYITPEKYFRLAELVPGHVRKVGVFVSAPLDLAGLDAVQIYSSAPSRMPVWRAYRIGSKIPALDATAEAVVLDGTANGISFDWPIARSLPARVIVAGGLDASNVEAAIDAAEPWGVDACSGIESAPGKKDHVRVRAFVQAAARAFDRIR